MGNTKENMKALNLLRPLAFCAIVIGENLGAFKIDFKVLRGNDKRNLFLSDERPYIMKRDSSEMELQNRQTFYLANIKIGSNEDEVGVLVDTGSSDLWVMSHDLNCKRSSSSTSTQGSPSSTSTMSGSSGFEEDILNAHNEKRAMHGVKSLEWNETLVDYAADYAASSFSCDNVTLVHSNGPYGENLAAGYSGGYDPVDAWYDEIELYDFNNPGFNKSTGHFTQLVWKSTSQIGCAKVICDNAWGQYTICEYSNTAGNVLGTNSETGLSYFAENVLKPLVNSTN